MSEEARSAASPFPHLNAPLTLGGRRLANRFVLAPMSTSYADPDGYVSGRTVEHYARRARGGAAMVITENIAVSRAGRQLPRQMLADDERFLPGLAELAAAIKDAGAVAVAQIVHSGRYAGPWDEYTARRRLAPSAVAFDLLPGAPVTPAEMTAGEIDEAVAEFGAATDLLRRAGFDGVEIHGAQGFLISSFQSPRMNLRDDEFGADRNLFARRVIESVAASAGEMLVGYHLMSDEMMPGGWSGDDAVGFASGLDSSTLDFVVPIPTTFESLRSKGAAGAMKATAYDRAVAERIAAATELPVLVNGGLGDPADAERALAEGPAAAVLVARALLCDPDLPRKALRGDAGAIIFCPCDPPRCLRTQLTGSICDRWPAPIQEQGFWGLRDPEELERTARASSR